MNKLNFCYKTQKRKTSNNKSGWYSKKKYNHIKRYFNIDKSKFKIYFLRNVYI